LCDVPSWCVRAKVPPWPDSRWCNPTAAGAMARAIKRLPASLAGPARVFHRPAAGRRRSAGPLESGVAEAVRRC